MADTDTTKPPVDPKDPGTVLQNATDAAQAEIDESTRKQGSYVYAAAHAPRRPAWTRTPRSMATSARAR